MRARERLARSERLRDGCKPVEALSLIAYREGASALPSVLEAQRSARETLSQYVNDRRRQRETRPASWHLLTLTAHRNGQ